MEFWFVAPDAAQAHDDRPTFLMITTGDRPATVTISMPAANVEFQRLFTETVRNIPANSSWKFEFSTEDQMNLIENAYTSSGTVTNKGILITSTAPVSVYYQIDGLNNTQKEIFTLKGKKALGTDFYMPFQENYDISNNYNGQGYRQIQIVATENNTDVTIHPRGQAVFTAASGTIDADSPLERRKVRLNKGQTLLWRENERNKYQISGTQIISNYPVAITLFEDCVTDSQPKSVDPIGDQMVPVNHLGQNYIVVKGYSYTDYANEHAIIVAVENDTKVWLSSQGQPETLVETLNEKGKYLSIDLGRGDKDPGAYYIRTSKPVYCMHQSAAESEIGGALLPSLYSISGRNITFIKGPLDPATPGNINALFLVFRESAKDGFILDRERLDLSSDIQEVGFDNWKYAKVTLSNTTGQEQVCTVKNDEGSFALGYFTGNTATSLYGYFSAFGTFSFESDTIYHCGDSYLFDAPYARTYQWTLPDNSTLTGTGRLQATQSGRYILTVEQDPYTLTDTTYLKLQNFRHTLSAPEQLLQDKSYNFTIELNPQEDPDNYFNATYEWDFGEGASIQTSNQPTEKVSYSTSGAKTVTLKIENLDAHCDTTITREITVLDTSEGLVMYWKTGPEDRNWNNVNNWAKDAAGTPLPVIPSKHTRVYLPGNESTTAYPSLTEEVTDTTHYGQPEVNEIVFRYGSELHYQHKLKYEKAYVNYNWGYYDEEFTDGGQPAYSLEDAKKLQRDTWHILATPLKSMASGDFVLAGHPFSWQKQFEVAINPQGSVAEGDFSKAFPTNDIALATTNNAIAVKMAGYKNDTGYRQEHLEGLKGVIEIPYFENQEVVGFYPAHNYDALSKRSYFYYFDTKSLKLINSPLGSMGRAAEAYRFVYETDQNIPPVSGIYEMRLNTEGLRNNQEVMVGNPLLAPIDAMTFASMNTGKIDDEQGYKLLSEDGTTWEQKRFTEGNTIPAWKAFIVTLQSGATSLSFPLEEVEIEESSLLISPNSLRASYATGAAGNALYMQVLKGGIRSGDQAILQNNRNANNTEIRKMILPEGHEAPEIFFMSSGRDHSFLIRNITQGEKEVPIGVKTSDVRSRLSLEFGNIPAFSASTGASLVLVDKHLNVRQDLTRNPVYPFTQQASGLDNQYVDRNRFVLQLSGETGIYGQDEPENGINIVYQSGILKVTSDEIIDAISVYDLYGRLAFSVRSINLSQFTHPLPLQGKLFLVRIKTVSGKEEVKKIMGD